jgi:hypothetical protein
VTEAHGLGAHHPVDHRAAGVAGAEAVPEALRGSDDERAGAVLVEGAEPDEVPPGAAQLDAGAAHQLAEVHLFFQPLDLLVRDAGHGCLLKKIFSDWFARNL